jgi:peptidoglycan/xylan/chitin deacetylase (PgdA/CDA1 family)
MLSQTEKPLFIWTYHRILPDEGNAAVSVNVFKQQIEYLLKKKYNFITTNELYSWFNGGLDRNKKYTMLTFDDGWADNLFWAQPILTKYGIKAVLAVNSGLVDTESTWQRSLKKYAILDSKKSLYNSAYNIDKTSFLSKKEIISMHKSGVWDIQAHGSSHFGSFHSLEKIRGFYPKYNHWTMQYALGEPVFPGAPRADFKSILALPKTNLDAELIKQLKAEGNDQKRMEICQNFQNPILNIETRKEFLRRIVKDMLQCKNWLLDIIGKDSKSMFWPWGHYSEDSVKIAKDLDFNLLFTMNKSAVNKLTSEFEIPRIAAPSSLKRFIHQEKVFSSPIKTAVRNFFNKQKK